MELFSRDNRWILIVAGGMGAPPMAKASSIMRLRNTQSAILKTTLLVATAVELFALMQSMGLYAQDTAATTRLRTDAAKVFKTLPVDAATKEFPITPERVHLGRILFFDPRISDDGTISCAKCHQPALYGTDGLSKSRGAHNKQVPRNAPTILNAGLNFTQHWDGVFQTAEEQAEKSLLGAAFANADFATAVKRIKGIPGYEELFRKTFPDDAEPVSERNWAKAIGAYERTLLTPSPFDEYLQGKDQALNAQQQRGLQKFLDIGCADCHSGAGVGGGTYEKFGVIKDYWKATGSQEIDQGRMNLTKRAEDKYVFKVPSLRNVEMTPPYFHDGSVKNLREAVIVMSVVQLDNMLTADETTDIVEYLKTLTGKVPKDFAEAPVLPPASFGGP